MKHLKTFESIFNNDNNNYKMEFPPEVFKLYECLYLLVKNMKSIFPTNEFYRQVIITDNRDVDKDLGYKSYSIVLNTYYYFVFQIDYKSDGMWIKYTSGRGEIYNELLKIEPFFDIVADKHTEFGWCFDRNKFLKEINNIDTYINVNKYNL